MIFGNISSILGAVPNLQHAVIKAGQVKVIKNGLKLTNVKTLEFHLPGQSSVLFYKMLPNLEQLSIIGGYIDIRERHYQKISLSQLTKLSLKNVRMDDMDKDMLKAKIPKECLVELSNLMDMIEKPLDW